MPAQLLRSSCLLSSRAFCSTPFLRPLQPLGDMGQNWSHSPVAEVVGASQAWVSNMKSLSPSLPILSPSSFPDKMQRLSWGIPRSSQGHPKVFKEPHREEPESLNSSVKWRGSPQRPPPSKATGGEKSSLTAVRCCGGGALRELA